ncbi:hypothetical protein, partial [Klebsiella pneumoniae]|uniref:hypothetical protein n=1 Tax=Klebsiella pneumoniae TaxID=573 RepID=UPI001968C8B9
SGTGQIQIPQPAWAEEVALAVDNDWVERFPLAEARGSEGVAVLTGTDGAERSNSSQNTIDIFADEELRKKQISSIVTDSTPLEEPKNWQDCNIFKIAKLFLSKEKQEELKGRYERGGEGYGHFKAYLNELVGAYFK